MVKANPSTIVLIGREHNIRKEALCGSTEITPGHACPN